MSELQDVLDKWQDTMEALPSDLALDHWNRLATVKQAAVASIQLKETLDNWTGRDREMVDAVLSIWQRGPEAANQD